MTTWLENETSVEESEPRECYEFTLPYATYRVASGDEDVTIDGARFVAGSVRRNESTVPSSGATKAVDVTLPVSHAVAQRWLRQLQPPKFLRVKIIRYQVASGESEVIWRGDVVSGRVRKHEIDFSVPSTFSEAMERRLPVSIAGPLCPHILYDAQCRVSATAFTVNTTISNVAGDVVTVASMGGNPDKWAQFGLLRHLATGEELTVRDQVGNDVTTQLLLLDAQVGDAVQVLAGCSHDVTTCRTKFNNNQVNFGGSPKRPLDNPFMIDKKFGIVVQT